MNMNSTTAKELADFVHQTHLALADTKKAGAMAAYMKTTMPFYGLAKPQRVPIYKQMKALFPAKSRREYEAGVRALWSLPHREGKYAALVYARQWNPFITAESIPLYEFMIRGGAWWDLVDDIAVHLAGHVYLHERAAVKPVVEAWVGDPDLWIRRTAILIHNKHKKLTDEKQLFAHCLRLAHEKEFFIRKAIGWALRQYSYTNPDSVRRFLKTNEPRFSGLTLREGSKQLMRKQE